jgi:hypothetical protein
LLKVTRDWAREARERAEIRRTGSSQKTFHEKSANNHFVLLVVWRDANRLLKVTRDWAREARGRAEIRRMAPVTELSTPISTNWTLE